MNFKPALEDADRNIEEAIAGLQQFNTFEEWLNKFLSNPDILLRFLFKDQDVVSGIMGVYLIWKIKELRAELARVKTETSTTA